MAQGDVPTQKPVTRTIDYGAQVRRIWGDEWHKPEIAYEFSNGRKFNSPGKNGGPYTGTGT